MPTEATFAAAREAGLLDEGDARLLVEAHRLFNEIFQWQRLTIEGRFDADAVPRAILKRLATVAGLPSAKALLGHLDATQRQVSEAYGRLLKGGGAARPG